ncbi:ABC transporter permease [Thalassobacillus sp. CUG 92003]|uniref:ABC transporter permease n=1 Tax=Thalassobacillus sp. CUG 92003 TaxID=2736641 RepID=UPI0015E77F48|nr:ABC transporter permease [Thalassobacillus sp. CUG 92003]
MEDQPGTFSLLIDVFVNRTGMVVEAIYQHIYLSFLSLAIVLAISIPLGIYLTRKKKIADPVIGITGVFQTIPSIALFGFLLPFVGIGTTPTIIALVMFALMPVLRNVYTGITEVDKTVVNAGKGMGMTDWQILWTIQLPIALPVIMAGVRTATILIIGLTTIAAFIGAGGLGEMIFRGVSLMRNELILAGAIPAAGLALLADFCLKKLENSVTPRGLKEKAD